MIYSIRQSLAQQIVETVKDLCGYDINYIDAGGTIFASTDPQRIGAYHEVGKKVVETGRTIEVISNSSYSGTLKGVNIPIEHDGLVIAAIGISGEPDEVRRYALLAQKITRILLHEQELDAEKSREQARKNHIISSLINRDPLDSSDLARFLAPFGLTLDSPCRTIVIELTPLPGQETSASVEARLRQACRLADTRLYTFRYPNEFVVLLPEARWKKHGSPFAQLALQFPDSLRIGIGACAPLIRQDVSCSTARLALRSLAPGQSTACYDDLYLALLIGSVPDETRRHYISKVLGPLSDRDRALLRTYFDCNLSLKATGEALFAHKNTVQYQLDRIHRLTGRNPRLLSDAVLLYLALQMADPSGN